MSQQMMRDMMGGLMREGWAGIEADPRQFDAQMKRAYDRAMEEALPVAKLFEGELGERVLLWLMLATLLRSPSPEEQAVRSAEEYAIMKARREGQNSVVFMILAAIRTARQEKEG